MTALVLVPRYTAEEVTSFAFPQECMTLEAANRLVVLWEKKVAFADKMTGRRSAYATAARKCLTGAINRVAELSK